VKARTAQIPLAQCIAYTERELAAAAVQAHTEQELVRALVEMHSAQCLAASVAHSQVRNIECMIPAVVEQVEAVVLTSVAAVGGGARPLIRMFMFGRCGAENLV